MKASFFRKGIQQFSLIIKMMIQKNLKGLERMKVLITSHVKLLLGNKYNSYMHIARSTKVASPRNGYEKTAMKRKKKVFQRRI